MSKRFQGSESGIWNYVYASVEKKREIILKTCIKNYRDTILYTDHRVVFSFCVEYLYRVSAEDNFL